MAQPALKPQDWFATRASLREAFLKQHGCSTSKLVAVGEDSAFRRYFRLTQDDGRSVVLMECVPDGNGMATPGHSMLDFVRLSAYLRSIGISAPQVYEADDLNGYLLLEDFGDVSFKKALEQDPARREELYEYATDALSWLQRHARAEDVGLPDYYQSHVHTGRQRLIDWYVPAVRGQKNPDGLVADYLAVWDKIEHALPPVSQGFLHVDFHFENLMWRDGKNGLAQCGVLDFQGAMKGPVPYDLANLLEDARVDVPADLRARMIDRYCQSMSDDDCKIFKDWYRVLATQFHCRLMGQFIRLAVPLDAGKPKPRYLQMIPRVAGYIREGLKDPVLHPLADWFKTQGIDFAKVDQFNPDDIRPNIRPEAF